MNSVRLLVLSEQWICAYLCAVKTPSRVHTIVIGEFYPVHSKKMVASNSHSSFAFEDTSSRVLALLVSIPLVYSVYKAATFVRWVWGITETDSYDYKAATFVRWVWGIAKTDSRVYKAGMLLRWVRGITKTVDQFPGPRTHWLYGNLHEVGSNCIGYLWDLARGIDGRTTQCSFFHPSKF